MPGQDEVGFWTKVGGVILSFFTVCFGVWKHTHARIDGIADELDGKASVDEMNRQRDNITEIFAQMKADRDQAMNLLRQVSDSVHQVHTTLVAELGKRPTREELAGNGFNQRGKAR